MNYLFSERLSSFIHTHTHPTPSLTFMALFNKEVSVMGQASSINFSKAGITVYHKVRKFLITKEHTSLFFRKGNNGCGNNAK